MLQFLKNLKGKISMWLQNSENQAVFTDFVTRFCPIWS